MNFAEQPVRLEVIDPEPKLISRLVLLSQYLRRTSWNYTDAEADVIIKGVHEVMFAHCVHDRLSQRSAP